MPGTRAEERMIKKTGLELKYHNEAHGQREHDFSNRQRPSVSGTLQSPQGNLTSPAHTAASDCTFSSMETYMRRASTKSCDSAVAFQDASSTKILGDLTNPIHPIFQRSHCHGEARQRYDVLIPAFQLASRFLQTDCLLPFWYTLFFSPLEKIEDVWHSEPEYWESFEFTDTPETLTRVQLVYTKDALLKLSKRIRFTVCPNDKNSGGGSFFYLRRAGNDGRIFISRRLFRNFREAIKKHDAAHYTWLSWRLACALCHELAHAVSHIWHGHRHFYFPDTIAAETGYDWEKRVIGAVVQDNCDYFDAKETVFIKWPSPYLVGEYLARNLSFGIREKPNPKEVYDTDVYHASARDFHKMFREHFWKHDVVQRGAEALRLQLIFRGYQTLPRKTKMALLGKKSARRYPDRRTGGYFDRVDLGLPHESSRFIRWTSTRPVTRSQTARVAKRQQAETAGKWRRSA